MIVINKGLLVMSVMLFLCSCSDNNHIECHPINDYLSAKLSCCLEVNVISIFSESDWKARHGHEVTESINSELPPPPPPSFGIAIISEGEIESLNKNGYDFDVGLIRRLKYNDKSERTKWSRECLKLHKQDCCELRTSKPIYSKSRTYSLMYAHTREYGWRYVFKFNKVLDEWVVVEERMVWIT